MFSFLFYKFGYVDTRICGYNLYPYLRSKYIITLFPFWLTILTESYRQSIYIGLVKRYVRGDGKGDERGGGS